MKVSPTALAGVLLVEPKIISDPRGFFLETWHRDQFASAGLPAYFAQDNHSHSIRGTLRGLHYQVVRPQGKLIQVVRGEVFDVAVDLRRSSATFGKWVGEVLSDFNHRMLWIPPGFAHGFYVLSDVADLLYKCTDVWLENLDRAITWDDPTIGITWPLKAGDPPLLSERDARAPRLAQADCYP
jgi:dTDP-4-dehydrorhamnose 3,5-epimerase